MTIKSKAQYNSFRHSLNYPYQFKNLNGLFTFLKESQRITVFILRIHAIGFFFFASSFPVFLLILTQKDSFTAGQPLDCMRYIEI